MGYIRKTKAITCHNCGKVTADDFKLCCEEGHENVYKNINEILLILPLKGFLDKLSGALKFYFDIDFNSNNEFFYIYRNSITFTSMSGNEMILPEEIDSLKHITTREISEKRYKDLMKVLSGMQEKCKSSSNAACDVCTLSNDKHCILKLFSCISGYRPHPHHGQEFGDVAFDLLHNGQKYVFQGMAKSDPGERLTSSSKVGREIIQQFLKGVVDSRVEVLGPICPAKFDDQLLQDLKLLARVLNKKFFCWDDMKMVQLLDYYLESKGLKKL